MLVSKLQHKLIASSRGEYTKNDRSLRSSFCFTVVLDNYCELHSLQRTNKKSTGRMKMNADLQRERAQASFTPEKLTNLLDGGLDRTARRRQLEQIIATDPTGVFDNDDNYYLHRTDRHVRSLAKAVRLIELCRKLGVGNECDGHMFFSEDWTLLIYALADDLPLALHWVRKTDFFF